MSISEIKSNHLSSLVGEVVTLELECFQFKPYWALGQT